MEVTHTQRKNPVTPGACSRLVPENGRKAPDCVCGVLTQWHSETAHCNGLEGHLGHPGVLGNTLQARGMLLTTSLTPDQEIQDCVVSAGNQSQSAVTKGRKVREQIIAAVRTPGGFGLGHLCAARQFPCHGCPASSPALSAIARQPKFPSLEALGPWGLWTAWTNLSRKIPRASM